MAFFKALAPTSYQTIVGYKQELDHRSGTAPAAWRNITTSFSVKVTDLDDIMDEAREDHLVVLLGVEGRNITLNYLGGDENGEINRRNRDAGVARARSNRLRKRFGNPGARLYPFGLQNFTLGVIIPNLEIHQLLDDTKNPQHVLFYLGIEPPNAAKWNSTELVTVCLLGSDDGTNPSPLHTDQNVDGRQTWPEESLVLSTQSTELIWP